MAGMESHGESWRAMKVMIKKVVPGHICAAFFELLELHHEAFFDCLSRSRLSPQNAESLQYG